MTLFILVSCSVHGRTAQLTADSLLCLLILLLPPNFIEYLPVHSIDFPLILMVNLARKPCPCPGTAK